MGPEYAQSQMRSLRKILLNHLPEKAKILDLCCGTGHVMAALVKEGYHVTGIDGSEAMLAYADKNASSAGITQADARSFIVETQFDAVISTSASLNHMMSLEDLKQVFQCVHNALKENGIFTFDINHRDQMEKWWRGKVVEGEIESNFAWFLVPTYDGDRAEGNFQVTLFKAPKARQNSLFSPFLRRIIYAILKLRRLTRFRFKLLSNFRRWEKQWERSDMTYPVKGYTLPEVTTALQDTGFTNIQVCTVDGSPKVDSNHSAHFVCQKAF
ncbi:MAG: class I SAM-dependent methyltransferase [Cyanothece sp. SIO2G6]|nr:class I SAM-dependent methyltransferase [Cyanothece sp. SIO2G6]